MYKRQEDAESLIWDVLKRCGKQVEQHVNYLSLLFVLFLKHEYYINRYRNTVEFQQVDSDQAINTLKNMSQNFYQIVREYEDRASSSQLPQQERSPRAATKIVRHYLQLFSQFKNLSNSAVSVELYSIFEMLMSNSDEIIASEALRCAYRYNLPRHQGVQEVLGKLTMNNEYRSAMLTWDLRKHLDEMGSSKARRALASQKCCTALLIRQSCLGF